MIIDHIPKFCLTLPEQAFRRERAERHFAENQVGHVNYIEGVNGPKFGLETKFPYEVDAPGSGFNMGPRCVGIWLSHLIAWHVVNQLPSDHALILEDDAKFDANWKPRVDQALQDVPSDFDFLFIGSCCVGGSVAYHVRGEVWDVRWPMCFQAYVVSKNGARILIETQRKVYAPIDISTKFHSFPKMKVYTLNPMAVWQFDTEITA